MTSCRVQRKHVRVYPIHTFKDLEKYRGDTRWTLSMDENTFEAYNEHELGGNMVVIEDDRNKKKFIVGRDPARGGSFMAFDEKEHRVNLSYIRAKYPEATEYLYGGLTTQPLSP